LGAPSNNEPCNDHDQGEEIMKESSSPLLSNPAETTTKVPVGHEASNTNIISISDEVMTNTATSKDAVVALMPRLSKTDDFMFLSDSEDDDDESSNGSEDSDAESDAEDDGEDDNSTTSDNDEVGVNGNDNYGAFTNNDTCNGTGDEKRDSPRIDPNNLNAALKTLFGFKSFRDGQRWAVQRVLNNQRSLLVAPTGLGKSLCYALPAFLRSGMTIVVSPLVSLIQVSKSFFSFAQK
jgi:ATP-dependent helicase YprA (DUF1998 family)